MKVGIVGLGYVGLVTAVVLASLGNKVVGIDIDKEKIETLKHGNLPIYEPELKELFDTFSKNLFFSTDYAELKGTDLVYIIVPTPTVNGKIDLSYVIDAAKSIKNAKPNAVLVIKSTVVPGTANKIHELTGLPVVSNPEFTREGNAVQDTLKPDRIVIGGSDKAAVELVEELWAFSNAPVIKTTNENAELIKYASNAFLATKISFINEIGNLCEKIPGADVEVIAKGMGFDKRIAPYFLKAGLGYGGSCFPKDTEAIAEFAREKGEELSIVEAAMQVNKERINRVVKKVMELLPSSNKEDAKVCVLGIAFKDNTNDIRESQALKLIWALKDKRYEVIAYDPVVKRPIEGVEIASSMEEGVRNANLVVVATEWEEFKGIKTDKPIIDARRILDPEKGNVYAIGYGKAGQIHNLSSQPKLNNTRTNNINKRLKH
jgi:UDPglucose 6-dehydrogenase